MKKIYFTPGPTELHPTVHTAIADALKEHVCSINHRSSEFINIYKNTDTALRKLMKIPDDNLILFLGSATECMDRIVQGCSVDSTYHFVNGAFAERFFKTAKELGRNAVQNRVPHGYGFEQDDIHIAGNPELICVTQNETSTGVATDPNLIYSVKEKFPEALIAVDIVTSAPYIDLDYSKVDCSFFSVQKGFGMPAGLGVMIINRKCLERAERIRSSGKSIGSFHNLLSLAEYAEKYQNTETPNVLAIYLLGRVAEYLNSYEVENMRKDTEEKAHILYQAASDSANLRPLVDKESWRSKTIVVLKSIHDQARIKEEFLGEGYVVGSGYGEFKEKEIRIANFPMHTREDAEAIANIIRRN